jgi:hypothetical protein
LQEFGYFSLSLADGADDADFDYGPAEMKEMTEIF